MMKTTLKMTNGPTEESKPMPAATEPSTRQAEVLDFIRWFMTTHFFPPTFRHIRDHFGWKSTNAVNVHVKPLVEKGLLQKVEVGGSIRYIPAEAENICPYCRQEIP
jgi:SOS-response transcriptional repressor LexA